MHLLDIHTGFAAMCSVHQHPWSQGPALEGAEMRCFQQWTLPITFTLTNEQWFHYASYSYQTLNYG